VVALISSFAAFAMLGNLATASGETDEKALAVLRANDEFYRAFAARDMTAMDAIWSKTHDVFVIHPGWPKLEGRAAVMQSWFRILSSSTSPDISITDAAARMSGGTAIVTCNELVDGIILKALNVFAREADGSWKMISHEAVPTSARSTDT
jgi:ketosteroid isomerase-like protein